MTTTTSAAGRASRPAPGTGPLTGRVALVTGAGRGIGAAIARRLGEDGAAVVVHHRRSPVEAEQVVRDIELDGGSAFAVAADIAVAEDVRALFAEVSSRLGRLDILVNNAGIGTEAPIALMPEEEFAAMIGTNLLGTFRCMQAAAPLLADGGRVVSISSGYTRAISAGAGPLSATKAGIEELTKAFALELASRGITVNAVIPNLIATDGLTLEIQARIADQIAAIPLGGPGDPSVVADVVAFLAAADSRWVTGQCIAVTGGL